MRQETTVVVGVLLNTLSKTLIQSAEFTGIARQGNGEIELGPVGKALGWTAFLTVVAVVRTGEMTERLVKETATLLLRAPLNKLIDIGI